MMNQPHPPPEHPKIGFIASSKRACASVAGSVSRLLGLTCVQMQVVESGFERPVWLAR